MGQRRRRGARKAEEGWNPEAAIEGEPASSTYAGLVRKQVTNDPADSFQPFRPSTLVISSQIQHVRKDLPNVIWKLSSLLIICDDSIALTRMLWEEIGFSPKQMCQAHTKYKIQLCWTMVLILSWESPCNWFFSEFRFERKHLLQFWGILEIWEAAPVASFDGLLTPFGSTKF